MDATIPIHHRTNSIPRPMGQAFSSGITRERGSCPPRTAVRLSQPAGLSILQVFRTDWVTQKENPLIPMGTPDPYRPGKP